MESRVIIAREAIGREGSAPVPENRSSTPVASGVIRFATEKIGELDVIAGDAGARPGKSGTGGIPY